MKNARGIILGHHKRSVETVLMQLCRGAKSGFKGIRPKNKWRDMSIYRPLLCVTKRRFIKRLQLSICPIMRIVPIWIKPLREIIRHDVLPKLAALYPGALDNLQAFSDYFNQVQTVWDSLFLNLDKHVESYNDGFRFPLKEWQELTDFLKCEFLIRQLNSYYPNVNYSSHQIKRIVAASADQKVHAYLICEGFDVI